tara:strand:+ start:192 stop:563 length:372 start_codon:yes stop_codon:yes gene_type:complete
MRKKYGIQLRGLGRALRPSGLGVVRPKPTGKGGKPLKPKPIRPGKKDGGKVKKKFPDLTGDGKVTRADVLKGRGVFRKGGKANTRRMNRLEELGRVDSEKAYSRKGKRNLKSEKRRIIRELNK